MEAVSVSRVLSGKVPVGSVVTVRGWVRTRRDSKAGLSFVHLHDGSCFDPLQVIAPGETGLARSADDLALWGEDELDKSGIEEGKAYNYVKFAEGRYDVLVIDKGGREQLIKGLRMKPGGRYVLEIGSDWTMGRM